MTSGDERSGMRSEDDLRAAFQAKAADAPRADDVLRAVRRETFRPPRRRAWLVPAAAVAVVAAIGVPLGIGLSHGGETKKAGPAAAGSLGHTSSAPQGRSAGGAAENSAGGAASADASANASVGSRPNAAEAAGAAPCRPDQVTVAVRRGVDEATLSVTSRSAACALDRVPLVQWTDAHRTYAAAPGPSAEQVPGQPAPATGVLAAKATATAALSWTGDCTGPSGDVVRVDWGAGPVEVHAGATSGCAGLGGLRVGAFTGLS